jgi:DNA polymerase-3 subunit delta
MIVKNYQGDHFVAAPPKELVAALIYGPDAGLVQERAGTLARTVVADLNDPFNVADFTESVLLADPARLADEAAAISMLGGRRLVRVRGTTNASAEIFETFLAGVKGDALVIAEAGDLARSAALRKIFEGAENAAAIACYSDSAKDLAGVVRDGLRAQGLSIARDALEEAVSRLGSDRGVSRSELEKLALYAQGQSSVSLADVRAVMGDEAQAGGEAVCDAAVQGDYAALDLALERVWAAGVKPEQIVRSAMGHFEKLLEAAERLARGENMGAILPRLRIPPRSPREDVFKAALRRWDAYRLGEAVALLSEAEALTRTTGVPSQAVTGRALLSIAAMARARN